jgi:predicted  nucleic acid-binding Zn-ribbon protein
MVSRQTEHERWRKQHTSEYIELMERKARLAKEIDELSTKYREQKKAICAARKVELNSSREAREVLKTTRAKCDALTKQLKQVRARIAYINSHLSEFAPKKPYSRVNKK